MSKGRRDNRRQGIRVTNRGRWIVGWGVALLGLALSGCDIQFTPEPIPQPFPDQNAPLPVSGFELNYEPALWNDAGLIQFSTNCYAYMLDRRVGFPEGHKLQPGELSGAPLSSAAEVTADRITELVLADAQAVNFSFEAVDATATCPSGTYKVALVVDPGVDYHWYRQNPDGTWSHKPGHSEVTDLDASGARVVDPATADRDYGFINYSEFGGYFCTGAATGE
jgi:hypothetical protein